MARNNGAPGEIRTPDRPVRSRVLYPAELRARCSRARQMSAREGCELSVGGLRLSTIPAAILQLIYTSYPVLQELGQPPTTFVPKTAPKPAIFLFQVDFKPHGTDNPLPFSSLSHPHACEADKMHEIWRGGRAVEGARLESVYTLIAYRGFESLSLRQIVP